jgi:alpha-L-fucosidase 2
VFTLSPTQSAFLVTPILSDLDARNHLAAVKERARTLTTEKAAELYEGHRAWWRGYWSQSFVEMDDPVLEKFYYASQYIMASASRSGKVAPGLYGPWVTTDHPSWNGDYTLNYNLETPYLGLYSSNHVATADSYDPPILDFVARGQTYARTILNVRGVYYPGHIGPWGLERPFDYEPFMGQKGNAAFLVMPMLMRFYSTYDDVYARKTYPFIKEVGNFWEDYLQMKDGHYVILDDCVGEVGPWLSSPDWAKCPNNIDPMNDLGFVRATFQGLLDMSSELNVDPARRPQWQNIIDHLSPYPTGEHAGKRVFLSAEPSREDNILKSTVPDWGTLAIWPANQIGLGEDPQLLETGLNTVIERGAKDHPLVPPAMARVGYDPTELLAALRKSCLDNGYPNGYIFFFGGGVESASTIPATINEMMLQSFSGSLRIFPVWPRNQNASFGNLRAYGAFLVSSNFKSGQVSELTIFSEKARDCTLENPWGGKALILFRNGKKAETLQGINVTFKTSVNETISIQPM